MTERLSAQSVADIVKIYAERVGLDPALFAGHSMRAGFLTSAAKRGASVRRLKNDPQTRDIPIIGMSAHAVERKREKAIAPGCDEFDAKPIEFESLVATIRRVLAPHVTFSDKLLL